jgi:hypothetical protein
MIVMIVTVCNEYNQYHGCQVEKFTEAVEMEQRLRVIEEAMHRENAEVSCSQTRLACAQHGVVG